MLTRPLLSRSSKIATARPVLLDAVYELAQHRLACAACGVEVPYAVHRDSPDGPRVVRIEVETPNSRLSSGVVTYGRCDGCAKRYEHAVRYAAATPWLPGDPVAVAERLLAAAAALGHVGEDPRAVLEAGGLNDPKAGLHTVGLAIFAEHRRVGVAAVEPWSFLTADDRDDLVQHATKLQAEKLAAQLGPVDRVPCPRPETALEALGLLDAEPIPNGCLVCGVEAVARRAVPAWDPWRSEDDENSRPEWTPIQADPTVLIGRGLHGRQLVGHTCPRCTAAVATHGVGFAAVDSVLCPEWGIPDGWTCQGIVATHAERVVNARRVGATEPAGTALPYGWERNADGTLPPIQLAPQPVQHDLDLAPSFDERIEAQVDSQVQARLGAVAAQVREDTKREYAQQFAEAEQRVKKHFDAKRPIPPTGSKPAAAPAAPKAPAPAKPPARPRSQERVSGRAGHASAGQGPTPQSGRKGPDLDWSTWPGSRRR